jgi:hypothetical protein
VVGQPSWRAVAGVAAVGLLVGCLVLVLQFARLGWQPTAPFVVGTSWRLDEELAAQHLEVTTTPGNGYDGQWFLGLAYDPMLGERLAATFDMPRYRAGRPLQAVAGWLLAGGRPGAIPIGLLAVGPLAGWAHALGMVVGRDYVPDAPVGPLGAVLLVGSLVAAIAAIVLGLGRATLLGRAGLLLGLYGLVLSGELLGRFLSSMRALAPTVLAAALVIAAGRWSSMERR